MTESALLLIVLILSLAAAGWFALSWRRAESGALDQARALAAAGAKLEQLDALKAERDAAVAEANAARAALAGVRSGAEAREAAAADKERALLEMKAEVEKSFRSLAHQALSQNEQRFLNLANETFEKHQTSAAGGVKEVVTPVQEQFAKLAETIAALDKSRAEDKSALVTQMRQVAETLQHTQSATGKLVNALRAAPKSRGRWGEETLRNVLEMSGLSNQIDFEQQSSHDGEAGKLKPDLLIKLPGGRCIVVDSKVALSAYLDAVEATDDAARDILLKKHAQEMRAHVRSLSSKEYQKHVPATADFVVMFVPGENFLAAAYEHDPNLFQDASASRVLLVGPSSLLALAKSIAFGWRQEDLAKNAEEIAKLGAELYGRLSTLSGRIEALGNSLEKSVKSYNEVVATAESRVFVTARKFRELGAGDEDLPYVQPVEISPRLPLGLPEPEPSRARRR
jgi:DNA recombination protein RmuC